jgi:hypothetical protein
MDAIFFVVVIFSCRHAFCVVVVAVLTTLQNLKSELPIDQTLESRRRANHRSIALVYSIWYLTVH